MEATGIAAGRVPVARRRFGCKGETGTRPVRIDGTTDIDANSASQCKATSRTILGAAHARTAVT